MFSENTSVLSQTVQVQVHQMPEESSENSFLCVCVVCVFAGRHVGEQEMTQMTRKGSGVISRG